MPSSRVLAALVTICCMVGLACWNFHGVVVDLPHEQNKDYETEEIEERNLYVSDRRMHVARDHKLIYVHIPKTGGSTVEDSSLFDTKRKLGISPRSHHSVRRLSNASNTDGFLVATHIRDPCERFMSAFLYLRFDPRSKGMKATAESFGLFGSNTTGQFVEWLDSTKSWERLKHEIFHFQPMINWLVYEDESFGADLIMCQEEWNEGIRRLVKKLKLDETPDNLLRHVRVNKVHNMSCSDLDRKYSTRILDEYSMDACLFGYGTYAQGEYEMSRYNAAKCIGSQFDRKWFSDRVKFCKAALSQNLTDLQGW